MPSRRIHHEPVARATPADPTIVEAEDRFVEAWGRMGGVWGISRTMAEAHALLYITARPLCTDDVMERLAISRGNASMSLRSLVDWNLVTRSRQRGDRREYFVAEQDVWALFRAIARERVKREVDPLLAELHEIHDDTARGADSTPDAKELAQRLDAMLEVLGLVQKLGQRFAGPGGQGLRAAANLLTKMPMGAPKRERVR